MTHTITWYGNGIKNILNQTIDPINDTVKVSFHTSSYTPSQDDDETTSDLTNELAGSGNYTGGGNTITSIAIALDTTNDRITIDGDDTTFSALTPSAEFTYGVIYSSTTGDLIAYVTFDTPQDPEGLDYIIEWAAAGSGAIINVGY